MFVDSLNISYFDFKKHNFANIELDAITMQKISLNNIISEHPLEDGDILNDAIHNQPLEITFSAVISDLAQNYKEQLSMVSEGIESILTNKRLGSSKSMRAWRELYALWKVKELVTISSPIQSEVFSSMAIKNISVDLDSTYSLKFTASLKQVLISENLKQFNLSPEIGKQSERT